MRNIRLFIWDFDGTLLDSYKNIVRYLRLALNDFGKDAAYTEVLEKMMVNIPHAINYYSELYSIPELKAHFKEYEKTESTDPVIPFDGIKNVLARIKERGDISCIFTNRGDTVFPLLERAGLLSYFDDIITKENPVFKLKPAPNVIFYLMDKYKVSAEQTVMIGDRKCDLESGYNARCKTLHLLTPSVPQYPPCDFRISDYGQMLDMLS